MALRATWQHHVGLRGAYAAMWRDIFIFTYIGYTYIVFRLSEEDYYLCYVSRLINPFVSFNFLRVGLSSTEFIWMQDTWRRERHWIDVALEIRASITWTRGPPITIKARVLVKGIITALMKRLRSASRPSDRDPRGANQGVL